MLVWGHSRKVLDNLDIEQMSGSFNIDGCRTQIFRSMRFGEDTVLFSLVCNIWVLFLVWRTKWFIPSKTHGFCFVWAHSMVPVSPGQYHVPLRPGSGPHQVPLSPVLKVLRNWLKFSMETLIPLVLVLDVVLEFRFFQVLLCDLCSVGLFSSGSISNEAESKDGRHCGGGSGNAVVTEHP